MCNICRINKQFRAVENIEDRVSQSSQKQNESEKCAFFLKECGEDKISNFALLLLILEVYFLIKGSEIFLHRRMIII